MSINSRKIYLILVLLFVHLSSWGQNDIYIKWNKSSLYDSICVPVDSRFDNVVAVRGHRANAVVPESSPQQQQLDDKIVVRRPLFGLKTNLLFDLATMLNVEVEVPIGKRWSVAGEWTFPWWLWENKQHCLELLSGNLEGRYWFGDRSRHNILTGWFGGLYAGGGLYDLEWDKKGYQGEFFIAMGVSAGYAHSIGRNLRLEYSLGIGYMKTDYRKYDAELGKDDKWHLIRRENGKFSWFGPTRAKISLVWVPQFKFFKKGGTVR